MQIEYSATPAQTAGTRLSELLREHADRPCLLLLSGGSAISLLKYVSGDALGTQLTISTLDERFSTDPTVNNFAQIANTAFYHTAHQQGVRTIDTRVRAGESLTAAGARFAEALAHWRNTHPDGVVVATLGVGTDGHTAGIFPNQPEELFAGDSWVAAYEVSPSATPHTKRITVTLTFLRTQLHAAVAYVVGEEKRPVLDLLTSEGSCGPTETPACVMQELPNLRLVSDQPGGAR